ncbi:universal stress protein [Vineibacter terrae]|uniref:universal stress protein n=1 Tax=Vineibacter terrae TaxID=2586908 RepID=UPI002E375039|nr:universal stress protein [Vineibacter terrae]HEX2889642.1 universal stress protein [Vineibacter terrae]
MSEAPVDRVFLVVVDETPELRVALRYACRRAKRTGGRVALLYVMEPPEPQHWESIGDLMREEAREKAEAIVSRHADQVVAATGLPPILHFREGGRREQLLKLLAEDPSISVLVLAAGTGSEGPGPLVSSIVSKYAGTLRVPLTIVPGSLTDAQIEAIS